MRQCWWMETNLIFAFMCYGSTPPPTSFHLPFERKTTFKFNFFFVFFSSFIIIRSPFFPSLRSFLGTEWTRKESIEINWARQALIAINALGTRHWNKKRKQKQLLIGHSVTHLKCRNAIVSFDCMLLCMDIANMRVYVCVGGRIFIIYWRKSESSTYQTVMSSMSRIWYLTKRIKWKLEKSKRYETRAKTEGQYLAAATTANIWEKKGICCSKNVKKTRREMVRGLKMKLK